MQAQLQHQMIQTQIVQEQLAKAQAQNNAFKHLFMALSPQLAALINSEFGDNAGNQEATAAGLTDLLAVRPKREPDNYNLRSSTQTATTTSPPPSPFSMQTERHPPSLQQPFQQQQGLRLSSPPQPLQFKQAPQSHTSPAQPGASNTFPNYITSKPSRDFWEGQQHSYANVAQQFNQEEASLD
jgi:hypothetical protein